MGTQHRAGTSKGGCRGPCVRVGARPREAHPEPPAATRRRHRARQVHSQPVWTSERDPRWSGRWTWQGAWTLGSELKTRAHIPRGFHIAWSDGNTHPDPLLSLNPSAPQPQEEAGSSEGAGPEVGSGVGEKWAECGGQAGTVARGTPRSARVLGVTALVRTVPGVRLAVCPLVSPHPPWVPGPGRSRKDLGWSCIQTVWSLTGPGTATSSGAASPALGPQESGEWVPDPAKAPAVPPHGLSGGLESPPCGSGSPAPTCSWAKPRGRDPRATGPGAGGGSGAWPGAGLGGVHVQSPSGPRQPFQGTW